MMWKYILYLTLNNSTKNKKNIFFHIFGFEKRRIFFKFSLKKYCFEYRYCILIFFKRWSTTEPRQVASRYSGKHTAKDLAPRCDHLEIWLRKHTSLKFMLLSQILYTSKIHPYATDVIYLNFNLFTKSYFLSRIVDFLLI